MTEIKFENDYYSYTISCASSKKYVKGIVFQLKIDAVNIKVEAIPMYNLKEEALKFHTKRRANGYVLTSQFIFMEIEKIFQKCVL